MPVLPTLCSVEGLFGLSWSFRWPTPSGAPSCHFSLLRSSIGPSSFCRWDCGQWCPSIQDFVQTAFLQYVPMALSASCSFLRVAWSQLSTVAAAVTHIFRLPACHLTFCQWAHSPGHGFLESASPLVCFHHWRCSDVKLWSWRRWIQWAVCPSRFLNLGSHVRAEWAVCRWNSCP
jgi:hypothetical protein